MNCRSLHLDSLVVRFVFMNAWWVSRAVYGLQVVDGMIHTIVHLPSYIHASLTTGRGWRRNIKGSLPFLASTKNFLCGWDGLMLASHSIETRFHICNDAFGNKQGVFTFIINIFPPQFDESKKPSSLDIKGTFVRWLRPSLLKEALGLKKPYPTARALAGMCGW